MSRVRVHNFSVSLDGFGTGAGPSLDAAFGHAGTRLHQWFFATRTFHAMHGQPGGSTGVDDAFASAWEPGIGAEIMGRGKFGPQRGPWLGLEWQGWWGDNPPFHTPVFVLTHHPRPALEMAGGTTFGFLDATPAEALGQARQAAAGLDVRIGGGPSTIRQFLAADLIDYLHIVVVPIALGRGERLWDGLEALEKRFHAEAVSSPSGVTHLTFTRRRPEHWSSSATRRRLHAESPVRQVLDDHSGPQAARPERRILARGQVEYRSRSVVAAGGAAGRLAAGPAGVTSPCPPGDGCSPDRETPIGSHTTGTTVPSEPEF